MHVHYPSLASDMIQLSDYVSLQLFLPFALCNQGCQDGLKLSFSSVAVVLEGDCTRPPGRRDVIFEHVLVPLQHCTTLCNGRYYLQKSWLSQTLHELCT